MTITENVSLSTLTTMRLGGTARYVITITSTDELQQAINFANERVLPYFVLGGGSNVIATDEGYEGVIILNKILGFDVIDQDSTSAIITIGAGENWDSVVARTVGLNLSGIEAMSAIPGSAGATPVQNVGAYGQEIADTLIQLEAHDSLSGFIVTLAHDDCRFSYRSSIFKDPSKRRHVITSITLKLRRTPLKPPFYASLQTYLDDQAITDYSPKNIRDAVIAIRQTKLPDPTLIANTGSFFKNPIIDATHSKSLLTTYPELPVFPFDEKHVKVAAGWLIEQAGLKGYHTHGMKTFEHNALVIVNEDAHTIQDLEAIKQDIITAVQKMFGIILEQEPETLST